MPIEALYTFLKGLVDTKKKLPRSRDNYREASLYFHLHIKIVIPLKLSNFTTSLVDKIFLYVTLLFVTYYTITLNFLFWELNENEDVQPEWSPSFVIRQDFLSKKTDPLTRKVQLTLLFPVHPIDLISKKLLLYHG